MAGPWDCTLVPLLLVPNQDQVDIQVAVSVPKLLAQKSALFRACARALTCMFLPLRAQSVGTVLVVVRGKRQRQKNDAVHGRSSCIQPANTRWNQNRGNTFFCHQGQTQSYLWIQIWSIFFSSRRGILDFYLVIYQEFAIFGGALAKNIWCISNLFMEFCPPNTIKCFPQVYPLFMVLQTSL